MTINESRLFAVLLLAVSAVPASAQYFSPQYEELRRAYGVRHYSGYPYHYSTGLRYDPYWSYNSSYFPETYHGDGSYYGLGYSYNGGGHYGSYYYW